MKHQVGMTGVKLLLPSIIFVLLFAFSLSANGHIFSSIAPFQTFSQGASSQVIFTCVI
jgi:hypothetical protein